MSDFFNDNFGNSENTEATASLALAKQPKKNTNNKEEGQLTVDVYQTEDEIVITSTIAGVSVQDMDISITNDMVTIKGSRERTEKVSMDDYYYKELYWGPFSRSVILPEDIDADKASASMKNGILTLRLPKLAKSKIKKLRIAS